MKYARSGCETRLWHKDLLTALPDEDLTILWSQVLKIAGEFEKGHVITGIYVTRVNEYPANHMYNYGVLVLNELHDRGLHGKLGTLKNKFHNFKIGIIPKEKIFKGWHNDRYLRQCYSVLEERHDNNEMPDLFWINLNIHIRDMLVERMKHETQSIRNGE